MQSKALSVIASVSVALLRVFGSRAFSIQPSGHVKGKRFNHVGTILTAYARESNRILSQHARASACDWLSVMVGHSPPPPLRVPSCDRLWEMRAAIVVDDTLMKMRGGNVS